VLTCNRATEKTFGCSREEIAGLVVYQALCRGEHREDFQQILSGVLRSGTATHECTAQSVDGRQFPANVSVSMVRDSAGQPEGMIWVLSDLSERERLTEQASRAQEYAEMVLRSYGAYGQLVGRGPVFKRIIQFVHDAARVPSAVLITGESGTGKEAVARSIHGYSDRSGEPFVVVDCAALKGSLLESELFGHERGAFTGAHEAKRGLVEVADGGTLFLDEIGEMPVSLQAKLLRVLERGEFRRVGSVSDRRAAIRVVAATNRDLAEATRRGDFRNDLFFRLNVLSFRIPPLRERSEDVHLLANHFLLHTRVTFSGRKRFRQDALRRLEAYGWPGNVRELANVVERAIILSGDDEVIRPEHLPPEVRIASRAGGEGRPSMPVRSIADAEKEAIQAAVQATGGNRSQAARLLGISTVTLRQKIRKYGIAVPDKRR
jgi:two-component system NtrC family response regulator